MSEESQVGAGSRHFQLVEGRTTGLRRRDIPFPAVAHPRVMSSSNLPL